MSSARRTALALATVFVSLAAAPARPEGSIVTDGAIILPGFGSPDGTLTIDPCAGPKSPPALPAVGGFGSIGSMTGSVPGFPGGGTGALGAFDAAINTTQTLAGGTYDYTTYKVNANAVITYTGAVTIRTMGDAQIDGQVTSTAAGASITFVCGGNFLIVGNPFGTARDGIRTTGSSAPVTVDAAGSVVVSSINSAASEIRSFSGLVTVLSHATAGFASLVACELRSPTGAALRARGAILMSDSAVDVTDGDILVQAFGGAADLADSTFSAFGDLTIEGAAGVTVTGFSDLHGEGDVAIRGFGSPAAPAGTQDVVIDGASVSDFSALPKIERAATAGNDLSILSAAGVRFAGPSFVGHEGTGDIVITAFGGSVAVSDLDSGDPTEIGHGGTGDIVVSASQNVVVAGSSRLDASTGAVRANASGSFRFDGDGVIHAGKGIADIRAGGSVAILPAVPAALPPLIEGDSFSVTAGAGGIDAEVDELSAVDGAGRVLTTGAVKLRGTVTSTGPLTVQGIAGSVDVAGATLATADDDVHPSSSVLIESYSGTGTIDATNATIVSGDSEARSGDVTLLLRSMPGPVVNSFFLPSKVTVKIDKNDASKYTLTASGVFDVGSQAPVLEGDATLTVGDLALPVTLLAGKKGVLSHKDETVELTVVRPKSGTSKASFRLKCAGNFSGFLDGDANGSLLLSLENPALHAECSVTLAAGKYVRGRTRGALAEPSFFVLSSLAKAAGPGKDVLQLVAGLATDGTTPEAAPNVRIAFGPTFEIVIDSAVFGPPVRDRFTVVRPVPGVSLVVLDYRKETITVRGTKLDLGSFDEGQSVPVSIGLSLDTDNRSVDVRMARRNAATFGY